MRFELGGSEHVLEGTAHAGRLRAALGRYTCYGSTYYGSTYYGPTYYGPTSYGPTSYGPANYMAPKHQAVPVVLTLRLLHLPLQLSRR